MCKFCDNSGFRIETAYCEEEQETPDFQILIYGGKYLRVNANNIAMMPQFHNFDLPHAGSFKINYCPMCGRKL